MIALNGPDLPYARRGHAGAGRIEVAHSVGGPDPDYRCEPGGYRRPRVPCRRVAVLASRVDPWGTVTRRVALRPYGSDAGLGLCTPSSESRSTRGARPQPAVAVGHRD